MTGANHPGTFRSTGPGSFTIPILLKARRMNFTKKISTIKNGILFMYHLTGKCKDIPILFSGILPHLLNLILLLSPANIILPDHIEKVSMSRIPGKIKRYLYGLKKLHPLHSSGLTGSRLGTMKAPRNLQNIILQNI